MKTKIAMLLAVGLLAAPAYAQDTAADQSKPADATTPRISAERSAPEPAAPEAAADKPTPAGDQSAAPTADKPAETPQR